MFLLLLIISLAFSSAGEVNFPADESTVELCWQDDTTAKEVILTKAKEVLNERYDPSKYRFSLSARWIPRDLLDADPKQIRSVGLKGMVRRYTNFEIILRNGKRSRKMEIQLAVKIERKLPVLVRRMEQGTVIDSDDLTTQWVPLLRMESELIEDVTMLSGKTLRRTVLSGQPLKKDFVTGAYLIKAGDQVKLVFEKQGMRIALNGRARQSGALNEEVTIYSKETRKKYRGRITAPGVVKWLNTLQ